MGGITLNKDKYFNLIKVFSDKYKNECDWPNEPQEDGTKFYLHNGSFSYGCAAPLHSIIRENRPNRIIEIGSGNSSNVISAAIHLNKNDVLFIDSSHVCKIGSDVNFLILNILPLLNKNVWIHFHDIPLPFEYPEVYYTIREFGFFGQKHICYRPF